MINNKTVSITTGVMNRTDFLVRALPTWLVHKEVDEFLIIDWGSHTPVWSDARILEMMKADSRIKIARVIELDRAPVFYWFNAQCHNLEFRVCTGDIILRLDGDVLLGADFFARHPINEGMFYCGDWRQVPPDQPHKSGLSGTLFVYTKYLYSINGYNERLIHYGREDDDVYNRLLAKGLEGNVIHWDCLDHIPHDDSKRVENLIAAHTFAREARERGYAPHQAIFGALSLSTEIARDLPWTSKDKMTDWLIRSIDRNMFECRSINEPWEVVRVNHEHANR